MAVGRCCAPRWCAAWPVKQQPTNTAYIRRTASPYTPNDGCDASASTQLAWAARQERGQWGAHRPQLDRHHQAACRIAASHWHAFIAVLASVAKCDARVRRCAALQVGEPGLTTPLARMERLHVELDGLSIGSCRTTQVRGASSCCWQQAGKPQAAGSPRQVAVAPPAPASVLQAQQQHTAATQKATHTRPAAWPGRRRTRSARQAAPTAGSACSPLLGTPAACRAV